MLGLGLALPPAVLAQQPPATGPASRAAATPELKGRKVEDVRVLGNTTVSLTIIRNLIRTQTGDAFDPATVQDDYQRIFNLRKFANVEARVEPTVTGGVIVIFQVTEQKLIKSVSFRGNRAISTETLKNDKDNPIDIKEGQAIDTFRLSLCARPS